MYTWQHRALRASALALIVALFGCSGQAPTGGSGGSTTTTEPACPPDVQCDAGIDVIEPIDAGCTDNGQCANASPCALGFCQDGACITKNAFKGDSCGVKMVCDGSGNCIPEPFTCTVAEQCDDGNPCTTDICVTPGGTCGHIPTSGHQQCPGGYCNDGKGTCCAGCNVGMGTGYMCVATCPNLSACIDGFCVP